MNTIYKWSITFLICVLVIPLSYGQVSLEWAKRGGSVGGQTGGNAREKVVETATDQLGNVYVLAINNPAIAQVDGHNGLTPRDRFTLASWDCEGNFRWMKNIGGGAAGSGSSMGVDTLGGIYFSGYINSTYAPQYPYFDTDTTLEFTYRNMFLAKYDTSGNFKWLHMPQPDTLASSVIALASDLSIAPNGDTYLYCFLVPDLYEDGLVNITASGFYILKYNADGVYQSITKLEMETAGGGPNSYADGQANGVNANFIRNPNNGRFILSGVFSDSYGTMSFGSTSLVSMGIVPIMYCATFDSLGHLLWIKHAPPGKRSHFNGHADYDAAGNLFLGGYVEPGATFNNIVYNNGNLPYSVPVIVCLDGNTGNTIWTKSATNNSGSYGWDVALVDNEVYFAGSYPQGMRWDSFELATTGYVNATQIFITRFNANDGTVLGIDSLKGSNATNSVSAAVTDNKGNIYWGGSFGNWLYPGNDTMQSVGGLADWFMAKYGTQNCNCTLPVVSFDAGIPTPNHTVTFNYTGTPADSVLWDYGDGMQGTGNTTTHIYATTGTYSACAKAYNNCGQAISCKNVSIEETGINNIAGFEHVSIYPNPAKDRLTIEHAVSGTQVQIFTLLGKKVLQQFIHTKALVIDINNIPSGIYILQLSDPEGHKAIVKFVKE